MLKKELLSGDVIDYQEGLKRFVGNQVMYEKYLIQFQSDPHYEDARKALAARDYQEVLMQVHPLKGIAGTLGMQNLFNACEEVVKALRDQKEEKIPGLMEEVTNHWKQVIQLLNEVVVD